MDENAKDQQEMKVTEKNAQAAEKAGGEQTHCLCGSSDESSFMICCDHCGVWYHGACLQVTRTQANRIETYACPPCISKDSSLKIVYRVPKRDREKSVQREKQYKQKRARNDFKTQSGGRRSSKDDNEENKSGDGCNNCINCFRSTNCGKCANCSASVEPCLKRICLQSDYWNKQKKKQQNSKGGGGKEEVVQLNVHPVGGRKERMKYTYITDDDDEAAEAFNREGGSTRPGAVANGPKNQKRAVRKKRATAAQKRQTNSAAARNAARKSKAADDFSFTADQRRQIAAAVYNRRSCHSGLNKKEPAKHCEGPKCTNSTRAQSKFCCEECGMKLARDRLRAALPERVQAYWDNLSNSAEQSQRLRDAVEDQIQVLTNKVRTFADFRDEVKNWISITDRVNCDNEANVHNSAETDFVLHCAVCTLEFPAKLIIKHMERCFVRSEKQSCYGTPSKSQVNPYNIFCEQYNKANNTFCKRLRVLCSEHYKPTEDGMKICGYPFAWGQNEFRPVIKTFDNMEALLEKGYCQCRRKNCLQHHNWIQNAMGLIDVELLNLLIKLDEWFEKKRSVQVSETMRGDVLSLVCNKTVQCGATANDDEGTGEDTEADPTTAGDLEGQKVEQADNAEDASVQHLEGAQDFVSTGEGVTAEQES